MAKTLLAQSTEIRAAFEQWLIENQRGVKLIAFEGIIGAGKLWITERPFDLNGGPSKKIETDDFLRRSVPPEMDYLDALDCTALLREIETAIQSSPLVIVQGAIVWPVITPMLDKIGSDAVRHVYLKKMMRQRPDIWIDEDFILEWQNSSMSNFTGSIHRYHAERRPWLMSDLVLERIEED
jgi:hypothetical protein